MTHPNAQSHAPQSHTHRCQSQLRHPNVMTEAERLALPDPCRPINERVTLTRHSIELYIPKTPHVQLQTDKNNSSKHENLKEIEATEKSKKITKKSLQSHEYDMLDHIISDQAIDIRQFIKQQQQALHTQTKHLSLHLPLSLLPRLVNDSSISLMKEVMSHYPHLAIMNTLPPSTKHQNFFNSSQDMATDDQKLSVTSSQSFLKKNTKFQAQLNADEISQSRTPIKTATAEYNQALLNIETKLYLMGQMYHIVLCIFLLCQCKSRKTLNPQITFQDLADSINQYIESHRTELHFLTQHDTLHIEPKHIELAAIAMDWQVGKQANISKRTTTISSQNPLTAG